VHLTIGLLGDVRRVKTAAALAHVIYHFRDVTVARELDPGLKIADQRRDALAAHR